MRNSYTFFSLISSFLEMENEPKTATAGITAVFAAGTKTNSPTTHKLNNNNKPTHNQWNEIMNFHKCNKIQ